MGDRLRLFVAVSVPTQLLAGLESELAGLRNRIEDARWTAPANQHVTLKFLGWIDAPALEDVAAVVRRAAGRHRAAEISLGELGAFPSPRRARVLWVGLDDPAGLLGAVAGDLDAGFERLGVEPEKRAFTAHLTLSRLRRPRSLGELPTLTAYLRAPFTVGTVDLYRSHLSPKGARYEKLKEFELLDRL